MLYEVALLPAKLDFLIYTEVYVQIGVGLLRDGPLSDCSDRERLARHPQSLVGSADIVPAVPDGIAVCRNKLLDHDAEGGGAGHLCRLNCFGGIWEVGHRAGKPASFVVLLAPGLVWKRVTSFRHALKHGMRRFIGCAACASVQPTQGVRWLVVH